MYSQNDYFKKYVNECELDEILSRGLHKESHSGNSQLINIKNLDSQPFKGPIMYEL